MIAANGAIHGIKIARASVLTAEIAERVIRRGRKG
jgi:energy-converting hydrogenase Eha subunit B